jgi:hypothetical protein
MKLEQLVNKILSEVEPTPRKFTVEPGEVDPEARSVVSKVTYTPNFEKLLKDALQLESTSRAVMLQAEEDQEFEDIFKEIQYIKNRIRGHLRNNYRKEYEKMKGK